MVQRMIFMIGLLALTQNLLADDQRYQADVDGMVCAFCAYSVSRDVAKLPGVDADSVDVDLENGMVTFSSAAAVEESELTSIFASSGFKISGLKKSQANSLADAGNYNLALDLTINDRQPSSVEDVLESVGELAAANQSKMVLVAPAAYEQALLKPILMGRQQVMKVSFEPAEDDVIHLQLYLAESSD